MQRKRLPEPGYLPRTEGEDDQDVVAVPVFLDGIRDLSLAPPVRARDSPPVLDDPLVDALNRRAQPFLVEIGTNDSHNLIGAQSGTLLPLDSDRGTLYAPGGPTQTISGAVGTPGPGRAGRMRLRTRAAHLYAFVNLTATYYTTQGAGGGDLTSHDYID